MRLLQLGFPDQQLQLVRIVSIYLLQQFVSLLRIYLIETLRVLEQVVRASLVVAL